MTSCEPPVRRTEVFIKGQAEIFYGNKNCHKESCQSKIDGFALPDVSILSKVCERLKFCYTFDGGVLWLLGNVSRLLEEEWGWIEVFFAGGLGQPA